MDFNKTDTSVKLSENIILKHINIELTLSPQVAFFPYDKVTYLKQLKF